MSLGYQYCKMINVALRMHTITLVFNYFIILAAVALRVYLQSNSSVNVSGICFTVNSKSTF